MLDVPIERDYRDTPGDPFLFTLNPWLHSYWAVALSALSFRWRAAGELISSGTVFYSVALLALLNAHIITDGWQTDC